MAKEHFMTMMPAGVAELCRYWCDEDCPADAAIDIAERAGGQKYGANGLCCMDLNCQTIGGALVWLKSRLIEAGVLRALAWELSRNDGTPAGPSIPEMPEPIRWRSASPEEKRAWNEKWGWKAATNLGYSRSGLHRSPLHIQPINSVADRVAHFEGREHCPYCRRWHRNGAALRLHVIENHLSEIESK